MTGVPPPNVVASLNLQGNFEEKLNALAARLDEVQSQWKSLRQTVVGRSTFAIPAQEAKVLGDVAQRLNRINRRLVGEQEQLANSGQTLGRAYNQLVRQSNRLNALRVQEAVALRQAREQAEPAIIRLRAEARAIQAVTRALESQEFARELAAQAAAAGLKVSADGTRLFDAEAVAAQRAAKAQEELAVARLLAQRGLDARGRAQQQGPPLPNDIRQRQEAERLFGRDLENAQVQRIRRELQANSAEFQTLTRQTKAASAELRSLTTQGERTDTVFNRISFTFRRLIGILAVFTIARQVVNGFTSMITSAIRVQAEFERLRVTMAGLIAASAEIRSAFGGPLRLDDQLARAQDLSIDQMRQLRRDALQTAASYEELANAFTTAVAPGIQAGLTLDQIRKITVDISQAATGLGLAQNQLAEEIRSLLQGTITARNTRVAVSLGISNEDIRRARETGQLFQFLQTRFAAISRTGIKLMDTFAAQMSNAKDAFSQLLAESSGPLFEQLKGGLRDVQEAIFQIGESEVIFNAGTLSAFRELFDGLARGVQGIRAAFASLDPRGVADTFSALGQTIGFIASRIAGVIALAFNLASPLVTAFSGVLEIVNKILTALSASSNPLTKGIVQGLIILGRYLVLVGGIRFLWARIAGILGAIRGVLAVKALITGAIVASTALQATNLTKIQKLVLVISSAWKTWLPPVLLIIGAVALLEQTLQLLGVRFTLVDLLGESLQAVSNSLNSLLGSFLGIPETASKKTDALFGVLERRFDEIRGNLQDIGVELRDALEASAAELGILSRTLGADSGIVRQLTNQVNTMLRFRQRTREARDEIRNLEREIKTLDENPAFGAAAIARSIQFIAQYQSELDKLREEEKSIAAARPPAFVAGPSFAGAEAAANVRLLAVRTKIAEVEKLIADYSRTRTALEKEEFSRIGALVARRQELVTLTTALAKIEKQQFEEAQRQATIDAVSSAESERVRGQALRADLQDAQAAALAAQQVANLTAGTAKANADVARVSVERAEALLRVNQNLAALDLLRVSLEQDAAASGTIVSQETLDAITKQKAALQDNFDIESRVLATKQRQLEIELRLAELRESGSAVQGVGLGLQDFAQDNASIFNVGQRFGQSLANGFSQFGATAISESVAAAFDPNRNFSLREALGNLLLSLGSDLLQGLISNLLSQLITTLGIDVLGGAASQAASQAANQAQVVASSAAISQAAGVAAAQVATALNVAGGNLNISAGTAATTLSNGGVAAGAAIVTAAGKAATLLGISGAAGGAGTGVTATGGRIENSIRGWSSFESLAKSHRFAKGFAVGGRPRGIDRRDTIPAWLRPGEWVIRPEAVRKYGDGLFAALNRGIVSPHALKGLTSGLPDLKGPKPKIRSFASGGPVEAGGAPSRGGATLQTIQFFDEQVMERAVAAGDSAMLRFARRRRGSYRSALGLEAGS